MLTRITLTAVIMYSVIVCFGQSSRTTRMVKQGITDNQSFHVTKSVVIRLSDTTGSGLPPDLFLQIVEQNPRISLKRLFFITTGSKPSSGYGLKVNQIRLTGNLLTIFAQEIKPQSDNFYSDVITTPGLWMVIPKYWDPRKIRVKWN